MTDRADRLRAALKVEALTGSARVLAEEAVLITGRLEELDAILSGRADAWLGITQRLGAEVAEVTVNAPLAEARQQALALKGVLAELAKHMDQTPAAPMASTVDEIGKKRAERLASKG